MHIIFCLQFVLEFNVFSHVGTGQTLPVYEQYCWELMCLAQEHNAVPRVGIEPVTIRFQGRCSTTRPPRSLYLIEPHREKTGFLPMRKQRRRSASR